ncbi:hypothetical protein [Pleionea litopenaei]|uniref:GTPase n=1 Tax=Pleionea litopenaei TaxID=3070815 RepID=A0AA51RWR7_9GAMM|nr:hypothetical protein [Pleionea sp. HL-JVS1]WMS89007.1 hypothetical protein Q9312_08845 [Pleionea sp. HL-JVS1]
MIQGQLGLSIRAPEPIKPALVAKLSPRHVAKWIDSLPIANVSDSSKRIYQMLLDCNKSALDDDERFKILMSLHGPVQTVLKSLSKNFTGHTLNLTERQKKVAALVQAIHTEMAIGFKIIIEHQAESPSLLKKSMLHVALFNALEYLSLTVVRCYQVYTDVPRRIWKEINSIFKFSISQKLDSKHCSIEGFQQEHSIRDIYKKVCLLSVANPYQLRQQEIESVFNGLQKYVNDCELDLSTRFDNRFVVDLNQAMPPMHQGLIKTRPSQFTFSLNLDRVVHELQNDLKAKKDASRNVAIGGLSARLTRHLLQSWAHLSSRNFARTPCSGNLKVAVGLSATHQLMSGDDEPSQSATNTLEQYEGSLHNATLLDNHSTMEMLSNFGNDSFYTAPRDEDVWAKLYRPKQAIPDDNQIDYATAFGKQDSLANSHYQLIDADIVNMSPGGYCIQLGENPPLNTQTGEVVGLVETEGNGQETWHVGVIRWLKRIKGEPQVQLGVQLIAPGAKPVTSMTLAQGNQKAKVMKALLLPELKGIGQPTTLLTNPNFFNPQQKVTIRDGEEEFTARLTQLVSSSQGYRQFYFELMEGTPNRSANSDHDSKDGGFDNVWDLI